MEQRRGERELEVTRRSRGAIKRGESKVASSRFPTCSPQSEPSEIFTELHREKREERDRGGQEDKRGNQKERDIQPVISSLSVLHSLEHTKRFTKLGREEKGAGGGRGDLVEIKESQKGERAVRPVILLPSKNGY